jgi:hypothetical protein
MGGDALMDLESDVTPTLQEKINAFLTKKTETKDSFVTGAVRSSSKGRGRPQDISPYAMVRFAALLERGAELYGARNYQKGMSLCRTCGAIIRHTFQYLAGDRSEDHAAAIMFNGMCLIDTEERIINGQVPKELNDIGTFELPHKPS